MAINRCYLTNAYNVYYDKDPYVSSGVTSISYDTDPGIDTFDRVFLLSADDVTRYFEFTSMEFSKSKNIQWTSNDARLVCFGTETAFEHGLLLSTAKHALWDDYNHVYDSGIGCNWWLRSVGAKLTGVTGRNGSNYTSAVTYTGALSVTGESPGASYYGVRPAIWLNISEAVANEIDVTPAPTPTETPTPVPEITGDVDEGGGE